MPRGLSARKAKLSVPVEFVDQSAFVAWRSRQSRRTRAWLDSSGFKAVPGSRSLLAAPTGELERIFAGTAPESLTWDAAALAENLPTGNYRLVGALGRDKATAAAFGWALGGYRFETYKTGRKSGHQRPRRTARPFPVLAWPDGADRKMVGRWVAGTFLVRDLVNTPAGDMDPAALAAAVRRIARLHKATCTVIVGDKLRQRNFPMIHAVGRASDRAPRLIDLRWGRRAAPRVTIVGKGVCFDSGGLDLKNADGMILMKKDMAGGAMALALGQMIMAAGLDVRLRVLIPAVENSISANAYRPSDVLCSRAGLTVEVGNTDAEGRLVLADALAEAAAEKPDLLVDFATLTGAQRVACGYDLPAFFTDDDALASRLSRLSGKVRDPFWRLPLYAPYRSELDSDVADIRSTGKSSAGGAITAALFLQAFVDPAVAWIHVDFMGWNKTRAAGRPRGGEAQGLRAVYALVADLFGSK